MQDPASTPLFRRVVVVLDHSSDQAKILGSAASLARRLDAEVLALFAEDRRLEKLEEHPFARVIDLPTGLGHNVARGSMQRHCRALVRRTRRRLAHLGRDYQIQTYFEPLTGDIAEDLRQRLGPSDLLLVERGKHQLSSSRPVASRSRLHREQILCPVLVSGKASPMRSVVVLYDGSSLARHGLDTALHLGARRSVMVTLALVGASDEANRGLREEAARQIGERGAQIELHIRRIIERSPETIAAVSSNVHAQLLIIPDDESRFVDSVDGLTERLACPVLVMRGSDREVDDRSRREVAMER